MKTIKDLKAFSECRIRQGFGQVISKEANGIIVIRFPSGVKQTIKFTMPDYNKVAVGDKRMIWKRKHRYSKIAFLSQYALVYYNVMIAQEKLAHRMVMRVMNCFCIDDLLNMELVRLNKYFQTVNHIGVDKADSFKCGYEVLRSVGLVE